MNRNNGINEYVGNLLINNSDKCTVTAFYSKLFDYNKVLKCPNLKQFEL